MEIRETLTTFFSSGTKRLLTYFWLLVFRHEERDNFYYADCFNIVLQSTPQLNSQPRVRISTHWPNKRAVHPVDHTGLASPRSESQLSAFFKNHQNSQPLASGHDVNHTPVTFTIWGFLLWHLWLSHPPRTSVNRTQCVHVHQAE